MTVQRFKGVISKLFVKTGFDIESMKLNYISAKVILHLNFEIEAGNAHSISLI